MKERTHHSVPLWLAASVAATVLAITLGGIWFYRDQEASLRAQAESGLESIARLKVAQIATWRADRLADGVRTTASPGVRVLLSNWRETQGTDDTLLLVELLESLRYGDRYSDVLLVDTSGNVLLSASGDRQPLHRGGLVDLRTAFATHAPVLTDLHDDPNGSSVHLDVYAPVYVESPGGVDTPRSAGAIVLQADAGDFLFPLVQTWPTASDTAETLLVERSGAEVVFLNEVRHMPDAALSLRVPITDTEVPAVKAVLGERGIVEGVDYRGEPVLAYLAEVPDSPWLIVSKVDVSEAFEPWRARSRLLALVVLALIGAVVGAPSLLWQRARSANLVEALDTERARYAAEARLGVTLSSIGDGVIATDCVGRIEFINSVAEHLTGWPASDAIGQPAELVFDIRDEETGQPAESPVARVIATGTGCDIGSQALLISRDKSARPISDSAAPIRDASGNVTGVVVVFRDQTDERAARLILRESARRYRELFDNMLDGFALHEVILDEDGAPCDYRFLSVNPAFERLTGLSNDQVVGKRVLEVLPETEPGWISRYGEVALTGIPVQFESRSEELSKDFEVYAFRPRAGQFAVVFQDVTERVALQREVEQHNAQLEQLVDERTQDLQATNEELQATNEELLSATEELQAINEELQATTEELTNANDVLQATSDELEDANRRLASANEAKSRFLRAMSHELRTPLNSIIGFSGLLLSGLAGELNDEQRRQLEMVGQSGRHLLALINDILDLSRIEAGRVQVEIESFDLEKLLREVVGSVRPEAENKGLDLDLEISADDLELSAFRSDSMRVGQILLNLLGNAVKFTEYGGVTVRARRLGTDTIGISVIDTGPGIKSQDYERIFGEFVQAVGPSAPDKEGTGLGLAISRGLAELLGGSILVRSRLGHGSTFTLVLPADPDRAE
jgi:PAS domain S-box-containing protein